MIRASSLADAELCTYYYHTSSLLLRTRGSCLSSWSCREDAGLWGCATAALVCSRGTGPSPFQVRFFFAFIRRCSDLYQAVMESFPVPAMPGLRITGNAL